MKKKLFINYLWKDPKRDVVVYVGKSNSPTRWRDHFGANSRLGRMLRKRKQEGYKLEPIIMVCKYQTNNYACLMECCLIEKYGREDLGKGTLYNLTDGGEGATGHTAWNKGLVLSDEQCAYIAEKTKEAMASPEMRAACASGRLGKKNTPEHIEKSRTPVGTKRTAEACANMEIAQQKIAASQDAPARYARGWETRRLNALKGQ